ncbi:DUF1761 domain-containing protein [uncultured Parasphingopyxis sp.]|uniref:DUF1761 domain-containing protein n=1 Tax=uncultured Parasphingopyxis sp. TaxID=1547918 RepID=UPI002636D78F|nr:DUF1761 domain-containing protein [uncultured Parasphingopyxis sp.]
MEMNYLAVIAAAVSAFVLGGLWYGPLFGKAWQKAAGVSDEPAQSGSPAIIFGGSLILSLVAAFVFAMFLGPAPELNFALGAGASAGLCWVAAAIGIIYLFERRPLSHFLINGGYVTLQFTLYGLILGLWH